MTSSPDEIVSFWRDAGPKKWFQKSAAFDALIAQSYGPDVVAARDGELDAWVEAPTASLALILLLDQFPRNIFRDTPDMFASDRKAVAVAARAIAVGHDQVIADDMRAFMYMPFMHAENYADQSRCVALFTKLGNTNNLKHAIEHAEIIGKFGRFPHRNAVLGRRSTEAEFAFLADGGFAG